MKSQLLRLLHIWFNSYTVQHQNTTDYLVNFKKLNLCPPIYEIHLPTPLASLAPTQATVLCLQYLT